MYGNPKKENNSKEEKLKQTKSMYQKQIDTNYNIYLVEKERV